jgi:tetratricopeptide (TPR) repeat protein
LSRETVEAKNGTLRELLVRKQALEPWDRRLNPDATIADIDLLAFREVLQDIGVWNPAIGVEDYFSESMRLHALVPALGGRRRLDIHLLPRNFALLLFGKLPTKYFPGAWTKVSFYPGKDRGEDLSQRYELTGAIISQARKALELLNAHPSIAFDKESTDPNAPKYPERALQEAVINAIVHRDYELDDPTSITVFAYRVEIRSPGALLRPIDREKFLHGRAAPSWRNQSLAWFFNKLPLAQAEGQGIPTLLRTMKQLGSPAPKFELDVASMTCVLPAHPRHELLRHVAEIERLLVQQDTDQAQAKLDSLLAGYPAAANLLDFLAHIAIIQRRPERVGEYVRKISLTPDDLPTPTLFQLIEALRESADANDQLLAREWLGTVSKRRLEADEVKLAGLGLRKLGRNEDAVQLIGRFIAAQSSPLAVPAVLYDMRARAKIDLAKKCQDTGRDRRAQPVLRGRAWDQCRQYLEEAESDIMKAIQNEPNPREQEYYQKDLDFVRQIMEQSKKPDERQRDSFRARSPRRGS